MNKPSVLLLSLVVCCFNYISFAIVICGCSYCVVWHDVTCTKLCTFIGCEIDAVMSNSRIIVDTCIHP